LQSLLLAEASAAQAHFAGLRSKLVFRGLGRDWPEAWDTWESRNASLCGPSPRNALHPFNAILNYAYMVAAAQIERALTAWGFDTAFGFLHVLKDYRASLVYDALELFRAPIDARIMSYTASRHFRRDDFELGENGVVRLAPQVARIVAGRAMATKRDLADLCEWLESVVQRGG
jgi:CRISP-associated protein Cas1